VCGGGCSVVQSNQSIGIFIILGLGTEHNVLCLRVCHVHGKKRGKYKI
jgi:hypothetical protein